MTAPRADMDELGRLTDAEWKRVEDASWSGGSRAWKAEINTIFAERTGALLAEVVELRETVARVEALAKSGPRGFDMNPTRPISGWDDGDWMDYLRRHEDFWRSHLRAALDGAR